MQSDIGLVGVNQFLLYDEGNLESPDLTIEVVSSGSDKVNRKGEQTMKDGLHCHCE